MKKIFSTLFALMVLGTSVWGAVTKIENGQYRLDMTMTDIATANSWTSGAKNTFMIGDHIQFVGYGANATLYNASTDGKGARVYETQNNLGVTKIGVNGVIDTLCLTYVVGNAGVISLTNYSLGPVPADSQIVSGTKYALKKDALCFYIGRTDGTKKDGKCDITNVYAVYTIHPSAITMDETKTVSVGDAFQIGQVAPFGAYQVWSSNNEGVVSVDQNGVIKALKTGEATITVTSPTITKSCVITVVAKSEDGTFVESLAKIGTMATWNSGVKNYDGETNGIKWAVRNFQRNSDDMIGGVQGTEMRNDGNKNYIAYQNANIEGGVKRIAFQWRATDATKPVYFDIDGTIAAETIFKNELQASADYASAQYFCREIGINKNYQFRITIPNANSSNIVFGPMTITPYLLYTTKTAEVNGKYTNTDLINNVPDTATVVYTLENNDGEASIDPATGEVTCLAEGEVTVKATWGKVYTFYTLKTHILLIPEISFAADTLDKDIYDAPFTNVLTTTPGVGDTTYTSSDTTVATVDANGQVTIIAGGTTTITASIAANATYAAKSASYVLNVDLLPAEGAAWTETFSNVPAVKNYAGTDKYVGDSSVYNWAMTYYQRQTSDDMVGTYLGTRIRYSGTLAMDGVQEGGIKAIRFDYRAANQVNPIHFKVNVDGTDYEYNHDVIPVKGTIVTYAQKFEVKKNTQFSINMDAERSPKQGYPIFSPITIAPYLLYTDKTAELWAHQGAYTHPIINNTNGEGTIVYSLEDNDGEASIDSTGAVTALKDGEVTVVATWGDVSTTYTLTTHGLVVPDASFDTTVVTKKMGDEDFINPLTTESTGAVTYASSDESVATVTGNGTVTIVNGGTVQIKATIAAAGIYGETELFYTLDIYDTPATGTYWVEGFDSVAVGTSITTTITPNGNMGVYKWSLTNLQRQNSSDLIDGQQGMRLRWPSVWTMVNPEGGIKEVAFDWYATGHNNPVHFFVKAGENEYEYKRVAVGVSKQTMHFAHQFNEAQNSALSFYMSGAEETPTQTYAVVGPVKIVPYLLYTDKSMERKQEEGSFTNTALINNAEGDVVYSVEGENADKIASINASTGEVTILGEGVVTVKATWGDVYTTYTLIAHTKTVPEISFAQDTINKDMLDAAFANALTTTAGVGDTTYISSNEQVATVAANGEVTIVGAGQTIITANIAENATFAAASASYVLNVGFTPAAGTFWKETFSLRNPTVSKNLDPIETVGDSAVYNWVLTNYDTNKSDNFDGVLGVRVRYDGYIATDNMEGGVKALAFDWRASNNTNYIHYKVIAGKDTTVFDGDPIPKTVTNRFTFARKYEQKSNTSFKFTIDTAGLKNTVAFLGVSPITIVPYLLYTTKKDTLDMKVKKTYQMVPQIDNRDNEVAIQYSFVEENVEFATIDPATGEVTATAGGVVTVKAAWGEVYTTYQLTILNDQSIIYLMRNDGSDKADTIVNKCGELMPAITLPTREGYRFNAYFINTQASYRLTVTALGGNTAWVANRKKDGKSDGVYLTNANRKWIYQGASYTLYAQWMPELTIALDNQEATTAGTGQVLTAHCANNNSVNLKNSDITVPAKTGFTFGGYFTETEGQGIQLIDAEGSFIAKVADAQGDSILNQHKMWCKDEGITLYAYWVENELTIDEDDADLATLVADNDGKSANVTLRRAMTADGTYNTIYLPFALTEEQVTAVFGEDAKVAQLTSSTLEDDVLTLNFDFVTATEAGTPYLVAPTKDVTEVNIGQVAISSDEQESTCEGGNFHGILEKQDIAMSGKYFLSNENELITYTAITSYETKGLRAYFTLNNPAPGVQARCMIGRGTTTVLPFINGEAVSGTRKLILNNQLIIIRDGKMYNAQGAQL